MVPVESKLPVGVKWVKLLEYFKMALFEIWHNKMRTFLTLIGIIIGIGAVIMIASIIQGAETFLIDELEKVAPTDILQVFSRWNPDTRRRYVNLNQDDINFLDQALDNKFTVIAPEDGSNFQLKYRDQELECQGTATTHAYQKIYELRIGQGRFINESDQNNFERVIVLGYRAAENLFKNEEPIGKKVSVYGATFTVVGVLEKDKKSILPVSLNDGRVFLPLSTFQRLAGDDYGISITAKVPDRSIMKNTVEQVNDLFKKRYGPASNGRLKVMAWDQARDLDQVDIVKMALAILLIGVAGITLLVAGIGVMNILLVIIAERTREIGIRKALGGTRVDIMVQFLIESIILCLVGGGIGVLVGVFGTNMVFDIANNHFQVQTQIPLWSILLSFFFTTGVGLFFGMYPALKAAKLDPIEALRH